MHGRVKVKTTEQQEREKKVERDAKLKAYRKAMSTILARRSEGIKDELQLSISAQVLQSNPDISTLWNIRKEVLLYLIKPEVTDSGDSSEEQQIDQDALLRKELELTQQCLMANPKSYGTWHHRTWSLQQMDNPDWNTELMLCQRFLKLDERNFHCWDYRKWVASKAHVPPSSELDFTMEKIEENFSNYSAWHYRTKLLPLIHPAEDNTSIKEVIVHKELDLVQNAAFTDPEDSSAWFYHTWLLGRQAENNKLIYCLLDKECLTVATTKQTDRKNLSVTVNGSTESMNWIGDHPRYNSLWKCQLSSNHESKVVVTLMSECDQSESSSLTVSGERQTVKGKGWKNSEHRFVNLPNEKTKLVLQQALDNCNQLLELEPDSKWTLYTKTLILLALDSQSNHKEILHSLNSLKQIDALRKNFYSDLESRLRLEYCIETAVEGELDLTGLEGSRHHHQFLPAFSKHQV